MGDSRLECRNIEWAKQQLAYREEKWLRASGWQQTCSNPGSYWMWQKDWDGKTFLVNTATAANIQSIWDSERDALAHPEDYED